MGNSEFEPARIYSTVLEIYKSIFMVKLYKGP